MLVVSQELSEKAPHAPSPTMTTAATLFAQHTTYPEAQTEYC